MTSFLLCAKRSFKFVEGIVISRLIVDRHDDVRSTSQSCISQKSRWQVCSVRRACFRLVLKLQDQRKGEVRWRPSMQGSQKTIDTILHVFVMQTFHQRCCMPSRQVLRLLETARNVYAQVSSLQQFWSEVDLLLKHLWRSAGAAGHVRAGHRARL